MREKPHFSVIKIHFYKVVCVFIMVKAPTEGTVYCVSLSDVLVVSWWRHQMETFSALLALCAGNSPVPVNSPHKGQWRGALMFSFIYAWINDWVNNREAGDLRRQDGHYDVIVMWIRDPCRLLIRWGCTIYVHFSWFVVFRCVILPALC